MYMDLSSRGGAPAPLRAPLIGTHDLRTYDRGAAGRAAVETFIAAVFAERYGARVEHFAPVLLALHDDSDGRVAAAAGYRPASDGPLYLERYLARPIQQLLSSASGSAVARADIVEVGHLAAGRTGQGRQLMLQLGRHLQAAGTQWVASTMTAELHGLFARWGIEPLALGRAEPEALGDEARLWGSYYAHRPRVLAGALAPAVARLARRAVRGQS